MVEGLVAIVVEIVVVVDAGRWVVGVVVIVGMIVGVGALSLAVGIVVEQVVIVEPCAVVVKGVRLWWLEVMLCLGDS